MELFYCSIIVALFVYMVDFGFGEPGKESPNVHALLSFWPFLLAKWALQSAGAWDNLNKQYHEQISSSADGLQIARIKTSFKKMVFEQGRELFTWQYAAGMCPICFHFWINVFFLSMVNIFCLKENIIIFILQLLISHLAIRILKKYF